MGLRSSMSLEQSGAFEGQFEAFYHPLQPIGKGAFGVVWLASRRHDEQEVRTLISEMLQISHLSPCPCSFFLPFP